jgi:uncharacterized secreted protein with C-terminal beta-propeller domain
MDELNGLSEGRRHQQYLHLLDIRGRKQGFENYKDGSQKTANALYVLDSGLNVGRAENVAPGREHLFRALRRRHRLCLHLPSRLDPLFAYDLSNPASPVKLGELKLPGFSHYLHVWADGRLFGLGSPPRRRAASPA